LETFAGILPTSSAFCKEIRCLKTETLLDPMSSVKNHPHALLVNCQVSLANCACYFNYAEKIFKTSISEPVGVAPCRVVSRRRGSAVRYLPFRPSSVCDSGSHDFALRSERHEGYTKNSLLGRLRRVRLWPSPRDSIRLLASQRHVPCQSLIFAQFLEGVCIQAALLPKRYCAETFKTQISEDLYTGDVLSSQNWPGFKPGTGASLTLCLLPIATYQLSPVSQVVLQSCGFMAFLIISDEPIGSPGYQGSALHDWPGKAVFPPQPMLGQIRHLL